MTIVVMVLNVGLSLYNFYSVPDHNFVDIIIASEMLKVFKLVIQPIFMLAFPGLFYYYACIYFQEE